MKKLIALALAAVMLGGFMTACNKEPEKKPASSKGQEIVVESDGKINLEVTYAELGNPSQKKPANVGSGKHVQSVTVNKEVVYVPIGTIGQIETTILPADAADPSIYYESQNEEIVKVDEKGQVLGVEAGATVVKMTTNDRNFNAEVTVVVYRVAPDETRVNEMITLINQKRKDEGLAEIAIDTTLNYAATERAFEEAAEGDGKMDDTRVFTDANGEFKPHSTTYSDYSIWARGTTRIYIWNSFKDVQAAFDAIMEVDANKEVILAGDDKYNNLGVGCFDYSGSTYWCILMYLR